MTCLSDSAYVYLKAPKMGDGKDCAKTPEWSFHKRAVRRNLRFLKGFEVQDVVPILSF